MSICSGVLGRDRIKDTFLCVFQCVAVPTWSSHVRPCPAVLRCHPSFVKVRCNWSIRVASVFHSFALVCLPVFGTLAQTARSTCHLCSTVLTFVCQFFTFLAVAGRFTCHLCSAIFIKTKVECISLARKVLSWNVHWIRLERGREELDW